MFDIFQEMKDLGLEQVVFNYDKTTGTKAITAIHDTTLGPALGGTRMRVYESTEEATKEAMSLARAMTYKCAASGRNVGGGKTVLIGDHNKDKNDLVFRALGKFIEQFDGRYYTALDMGTESQDLVWASQETSYITGMEEKHGGTGNTAIPTSEGIYIGIKESLREKYGHDDLQGIRVAIQGMGKVGRILLDKLYKEGAQITIDDYHPDLAQDLARDYPGLKVVDHKQIHKEEVNIFAPCSIRGIINQSSIKDLRCDIIAGSANSQLGEDSLAEDLKDMGILYAPDFVINAGGLIQVALEAEGLDTSPRAVLEAVKVIGTNLRKTYQISKEENISTNQAAINMAQARIDAIGQMNNRLI